MGYENRTGLQFFSFLIPFAQDRIYYPDLVKSSPLRRTEFFKKLIVVILSSVKFVNNEYNCIAITAKYSRILHIDGTYRVLTCIGNVLKLN